VINSLIKKAATTPQQDEFPPIQLGAAQIAFPNGIPSSATQLGPGIPVDITLPGSRTVIETQREYLVNLNDLESTGDFELINRPEFPRTVALPIGYEFLAQLYTWVEFEYIPQSTGSSGPSESSGEDPSQHVRTPPKGATYSKMLAQDQVQILQVSWTDRTVYRIGSIGDGRCLIHSFLNAFWPECHRGNNDVRVKLAAKFRYELGQYINKANPDAPGYSYWMTVGDAFYLKSYLSYLEIKEIADSDNPVALLGFDPRPQEVIKILDS
jgi:hypothetical protein